MLLISELMIFIMLVPVLTIAAIIDIMRRPQSDWSQSGENQAVWAVIVILVAVVGPILYFTIARPRFERAPYA